MNILSKLPQLVGSERLSKVQGQALYNEHTTFIRSDLGDWYDPVMLAPSMIGEMSTSSTSLVESINILERLEEDAYIRYLREYYTTGIQRFGSSWRYADIVTVLLAAAKLVNPQRYLEIGVRRGRSMAIVAANCPRCHIVGVDLWMDNYADMSNPGPEFVRAEIVKLGYTGKLDFVTGNSHITLPQYFQNNPNVYFDLVTVDGDHSEKGAEQDLRDVMPHVKVGGLLVFDDICHPAHPYLKSVWRRVVSSDYRFSTWEFTELGYGVACAVRRSV